MVVLKLTLQRTYHEMGFFNVPVSHDKYVRPTEGQVRIRLGRDGEERSRAALIAARIATARRGSWAAAGSKAGSIRPSGRWTRRPWSLCRSSLSFLRWVDFAPLARAHIFRGAEDVIRKVLGSLQISIHVFSKASLP